MSNSRAKRILILGGGFGGVYTAIELERLLGKDPRIEIALVTKENYLVFQPMLPEVISGSIGILDTIVPIRRLCPKTHLHTRTIESIDLKTRVVTAASGVRPRPHLLEYDQLVIALGNVVSFAAQSGLQEHALPFKHLGDGLALRNHIINALEEAAIETDPEARRALLSFVVAGGGFSGVEAAAELNDFVREAARSFRGIDRSEIRVALLHAGALILPELPESLGRFAQRVLLKRGVEIWLHTRLAGATAEYALLEGGEKIPTRTLVSTVPSAPNPLVAALECKKERGRIVVNEFMALPEVPGVWALGDCALVPEAGTGRPCPPTAQHATRQAKTLAANIIAGMRGETKKPFAFNALGKLASLGHHSAVAEVMGIRLSGFIAWMAWRGIYLMKMPGLDRKLRVATDWALDLVLPPDIVQLRTERSADIGRQHFNPDEIIFRQGDRGDRVYVITDGTVEVARAGSDGEVVLARLGPGDCFGEMALVDDRPRNATARSLTQVNVLTLDRGAFGTLFAYLPPLRDLFQGLIAERRAAPPAEGNAPAAGSREEIS